LANQRRVSTSLKESLNWRLGVIRGNSKGFVTKGVHVLFREGSIYQPHVLRGVRKCGASVGMGGELQGRRSAECARSGKGLQRN